MSERIKPCPFCGRDDRKVGIRRMGNKGYRVVCGACGGCGPYVAIKEWHENKMIAQGQAIKGWNTRKPMERIVEQLEEKAEEAHDGYNPVIAQTFRRAIEIVKAGGKHE